MVTLPNRASVCVRPSVGRSRVCWPKLHTHVRKHARGGGCVEDLGVVAIFTNVYTTSVREDDVVRRCVAHARAHTCATVRPLGYWPRSRVIGQSVTTGNAGYVRVCTMRRNAPPGTQWRKIVVFPTRGCPRDRSNRRSG